jgi:phosphatidylglycerophosphatase C
MQAEKKVPVAPTLEKPLSPSTEVKKKKLVLFDFDGTITTRDTLLEFLLFYKGIFKVGIGAIVLSPMLMLFALKLIPNWKAKQILLKYFFGSIDRDTFNRVCREFATTKLPTLVRPKALHMIEQYKRDNAMVIVVSASPENWIGPWCEQHGLHYLATQLDVVDNKITGQICGKNCYGPEKVSRIKGKYSLDNFDEIIAYGDSSGDREMFSIAHHTFYKPFRD